MDKVKIIVATHKKYEMPKDSMYIPLQVGASLNTEDFGYEKDNSGDNISSLNPYFCELTGLYWAWKNVNAEYIGLSHYRRHFRSKSKKSTKFDSILSYDDIRPYLGKISIFLPKKRRYYIETLYSHYAHTHDKRHLDITRDIINDYYPEYLVSFDKVVDKTSGYMFNMCIMKNELLNDYCTWLFDILFKLKDRIDINKETGFNKRLFGRVSEILLNVWVEYCLMNNTIKYGNITEFLIIYIEKVNWLNKIFHFLCAKFLNIKYKKSL